MDPALVALLRCPVTRQPLRVLEADEATALGLPARSVLLREDGLVYYEFEEHGFAHLLPEAGRPVPGAATIGSGEPSLRRASREK